MRKFTKIAFAGLLLSGSAAAATQDAYEGCSVTESLGSSYSEASGGYQSEEVTANYRFDGSYQQESFRTKLIGGIEIQFYSGPGSTDGHDAYGISAVITDIETGASVHSADLSARMDGQAIPPNYQGLVFTRANRDRVSIYCTRFVAQQ